MQESAMTLAAVSIPFSLKGLFHLSRSLPGMPHRSEAGGGHIDVEG
jgi:hypothetical protein